jgi:hypothetical protein
MTKLDDLRDSSRQRANDLFRKAKKESAAQLSRRDKERAAEAEKTARLRELRLAKEAAASRR